MRDIAVVCGPTAAGKSAIAMAIAERVGAIIISADSRQIYRHFDIGTAKPEPAERARVPHRGIDVIEPTERYSAAAWVAAAHGWLDEATARDTPVVIVGGTGFYLRALEEPLFESPPLDAAARRRVQDRLATESTESLRAQCVTVDPGRAHLGRTQLLRALEMHALTGRPLSAWLAERARPATVRAHYLRVDPGATLRTRIADRVEAMLARGWEREVRELMVTVPSDAPAWNACGYGAIRSALRGELSRRDAIDATVIETRQYAKRQRTWFRHQLPPDRVTDLDPSHPGAIEAGCAWYDAVSRMELM